MVLLRKASSLDFLWKEFLLWQTLQDFWFPCQQVNSSCMLIQKSQKKNLCKISDSVVSKFDPHPLSADGHECCIFHLFHRKDISPVRFQNYFWKLYVYICTFKLFFPHEECSAYISLSEFSILATWQHQQLGCKLINFSKAHYRLYLHPVL